MRNRVEEKPGFELPRDVPIMPSESLRLPGDLKMDISVREKSSSTRRNDTLRKMSQSLKKKKKKWSSITLLNTLLELLHRLLLSGEDGGSGSEEITFISPPASAVRSDEALCHLNALNLNLSP